jgi:ABC-type phosphate transport system substrate-binding protein
MTQRSSSSFKWPTRRTALRFALALAVATVLAPSVFAEGSEDFVVVVHPDNPQGAVSRDFLREAFLKRITEWPDKQSIKPADQKPFARVRDSFSRNVLGRSVAAVKSYWQQRIFSGRGVPPPELDSDQAVISYVLKHRGGVGYVSTGADLGGAKSVAIK